MGKRIFQTDYNSFSKKLIKQSIGEQLAAQPLLPNNDVGSKRQIGDAKHKMTVFANSFTTNHRLPEEFPFFNRLFFYLRPSTAKSHHWQQQVVIKAARDDNWNFFVRHTRSVSVNSWSFSGMADNRFCFFYDFFFRLTCVAYLNRG